MFYLLIQEDELSPAANISQPLLSEGTLTSQLPPIPNTSGLPESTENPIDEDLSESISSGVAKGYLHNLSPLKKNGGYFDFQIQTKHKTVRAVCFSPQKRKLLKSYFDKESPVKLKKCRLETKCNSEDLMLEDDSEIEPLTDIDFSKIDLPTNFTIATLKNVSIGQLVAIKAKVVSTNEKKEVKNGTLSLMEAHLIDEHDSIKIVLWEQYIDQVNVNKTYTFTNVRVKKNALTKEIYLNTAKRDQSEISEAPPFDTPLAIPVNCINDHNTITQEGEVIAVDKISSYYSCYKCSKKVDPTNCKGVLLGTCNCCKSGKQKLKANQHKWVAEIAFHNGNENITLTVFHNIFQVIFHDLEIDSYKSAEMSQNQISDILLQLPNIEVSYDKKKRIVQTIKILSDQLN